MHEHQCPMCGSVTISCKHCGWTWNPKDPEHVPDRCPRCRNDWKHQTKWIPHSKYGYGSIDPQLHRKRKKMLVQ